MRCVFAVVEQDGGHRGDSALESLDLLGRAIFILLSLNYQDWAADRIQEWFDIPVAKNGIEPDIVPGPEERIDIRVIPAQTLGQVRFKVLRRARAMLDTVMSSTNTCGASRMRSALVQDY